MRATASFGLLLLLPLFARIAAVPADDGSASPDQNTTRKLDLDGEERDVPRTSCLANSDHEEECTTTQRGKTIRAIQGDNGTQTIFEVVRSTDQVIFERAMRKWRGTTDPLSEDSVYIAWEAINAKTTIWGTYVVDPAFSVNFRHGDLVRFGRSLRLDTSYAHLLFPYRDQHQHWILINFNFQRAIVKIFDPRDSTRDSPDVREVRNEQSRMLIEGIRLGPLGAVCPAIAAWRFDYPKWASQNESHDSGVYVTHALETLLRRDDPLTTDRIEPKKYRETMAARLEERKGVLFPGRIMASSQTEDANSSTSSAAGTATADRSADDKATSSTMA